MKQSKKQWKSFGGCSRSSECQFANYVSLMMRTPVYHPFLAGAVAAAVLIAPHGAWGELSTRVRQPVALVFADEGKTVLVANRRSGSLSIIDATMRLVVAEHDVGRGLADLAVQGGGSRLLAIDEASNDLLLLEYRDRAVRVLDRLKLKAGPVRLAVLGDGSSCACRCFGRGDYRSRRSSRGRPAQTRLSCPQAISSCRFARASWRPHATARNW